MSAAFRLRALLNRLATGKEGNFAVATAIIIPVLFAAVAISLDMSRLVSDKTRLSAALDAASLATSSALANGDITTAEAQSYAIKIASGQLMSSLSPSQLIEFKASVTADVNSSGTQSNKSYTVKVNGRFSEQLMAFSTFHAGGSKTIGGSSTSTSAAKMTSGLSLYLVLDRSGSMSWTTTTVDSSQPYGCWNYFEQYWPYKSWSRPCYVNKMGSLKTAAATLFSKLDDIENADTSNSVVRVGAVSFNDQTQSPSNLAWGTKKASQYVDDLPDDPTGGTDMTGGVDKAYNALIAQSEANAQSAKGNTTFKKFMVLMTDGENTGSSGNWNQSLDNQTLATCTAARNAGVTIYTVAYMAPSNGEALLKSCAGSSSNYYKATDMDSLVKAFNDIGGKVTDQQTRMIN